MLIPFDRPVTEDLFHPLFHPDRGHILSFDSDNPFESSQSGPEIQGLSVNAGILQALRQTKPWVTMMGVLCFIAAVLTILGGLTVVFFVAFGGGGVSRAPLAMGIGMAVAYLAIGLMYILPGTYLMRYSRRIKALLASPSTSGLEEALVAQKSFWKCVGMMFLALILLYVLMVVGMIGFSLLVNPA